MKLPEKTLRNLDLNSIISAAMDLGILGANEVKELIKDIAEAQS